MHESRERGLPLAPGAPELLHSPGHHTEDSPTPTWSTWSLGTNVHCPKHTQRGPAMGILSWVTKPYTRTIPYHAINTQRAVAKCLTINQGTQTEMGGGGEVCGGAEKLAVPPGSLSRVWKHLYSPLEPRGSLVGTVQRVYIPFPASLPKGGASEIFVTWPRKVWYLHSWFSYVIYPFRTN